MPTMDKFFAICKFLEISPAEFFRPLDYENDQKMSEMTKLIETLNDNQLDAVMTILKALNE